MVSFEMLPDIADSHEFECQTIVVEVRIFLGEGACEWPIGIWLLLLLLALLPDVVLLVGTVAPSLRAAHSASSSVM